MSLVKWIRKNNRKIMVFVVIFSMVAFVIGQFGLKLILGRFDPNKKVFATYDTGKINNLDISAAQNELSVLRLLSSDRLLAVQGTGGALLCHLIFPDSAFIADLDAQLKQAVQRGQIELSVEDLEAYFNQQPESAAVLWILLKAEANRAGYCVSSNTAKTILNGVVPQLTQGQGTASQLVAGIMRQTGLTDVQIVNIFADLLSVSDYANQVMANQAVTLNEVKASLGRSKERLDAEYVKIDAESLLDAKAGVSDADIAAQFEAYKAVAAHTVTADNPYGFGYKLPKRVQLEYLIVQANDVKAKIAAPTNAEKEQYYRINIAEFQTSTPSDPNDPKSEPIVTTKPYAEAEREITTKLINQKTAALTNSLFSELKDLTETGFAEITFEEATNDQLQKAAGEYDVAAAKISETHGIPVKTGKTGWLSAVDFQNEKILRTLNRQQGQTRLRLADLAFIASTEPKPQRHIGLPAVRVWENIGPVNGSYWDADAGDYHTMTALVRVVGIEEAAVAADVNVTYNTRGIALFETDKEKENTVFSLKERVADDLRRKKAMDAAIARGQELAALVKNSDWAEAVKAYNAKYAPGADDPNHLDAAKLAVKIEFANDQTRMAQSELAMAQRYMIENPAAAGNIQRYLATNELNNQLYALLPEGAESTGTITEVLPLEAGQACYVVKSVIRQPATEKDYLDAKTETAMQLSAKTNATLALVHYSPENILKRMHFKYTKHHSSPEDADTEAATEDAK